MLNGVVGSRCLILYPGLLANPSISGLSLQFFRCETFSSPLGSDTFMVADYSLRCYDDTWNGMLVLALAVIVFFTCGVPLLSAAVLWRRRRTLEEPATQRLLGIMYKTYRPGAYLFEPLQMAFKGGSAAVLARVPRCLLLQGLTDAPHDKRISSPPKSRSGQP